MSFHEVINYGRGLRNCSNQQIGHSEVEDEIREGRAEAFKRRGAFDDGKAHQDVAGNCDKG